MQNFQSQQMLDEQRRKQVERQTQSETLSDLVRYFADRFVESRDARQSTKR
ncbi:MAG: hypothetical protein OHK0046_00680 [Anaerolineae bacterium]